MYDPVYLKRFAFIGINQLKRRRIAELGWDGVTELGYDLLPDMRYTWALLGPILDLPDETEQPRIREAIIATLKNLEGARDNPAIDALRRSWADDFFQDLEVYFFENMFIGKLTYVRPK